MSAPLFAGRVLLGLLCLLLCLSPSHAAVGPDLGPVGDFSLQERSGRTVTQDDLLGKVWIASFQFTRCTGPCPAISKTMQRLQNDLRSRPDVRLVTFTVDPERDDPAELTRYAERFGADPERWLFLTGSEKQLAHLFRDQFHVHVAQRQGKERTPGREVEHTPKLVLVDRAGHIRGYYDGLPDEPVVKGEPAGVVLTPGSQRPLDPEAAFEQDLKQLKRDVDSLLPPGTPWYLSADFSQFNFPQFNAVLNGVCVVLLLLGYGAIRLRLVRLHTALMLTAIAVSALFLTSYLYFHIVIKGGRPTRFADQAIGAPAWVGVLYAAILLSHTILAVVATPLALYTAYQGLWGRLQRHVWIARWTLPIWLYVSVTGVVVYWMLYRLYP